MFLIMLNERVYIEVFFIHKPRRVTPHFDDLFFNNFTLMIGFKK